MQTSRIFAATEPGLGRAARRAAALGLTLAAIHGAVGCGGIGPGDYILYRVAVSAPSRGSDCELPIDEQDDTSSFRQSGTFVLYAGPEDQVYLDIGALTLEGKEEGDGYEFSGRNVDVQYIGQTDTATSTNTTTISVVIDGASITGSIVTTLSTRYDCVDPAQCLQNTSCTESYEFVGTEIEDVELQHDPAAP